MIKYFLPALLVLMSFRSRAQGDSSMLLHPDRVFDGTQMHDGWAVLIQGSIIVKTGKWPFTVPTNTVIVDMQGTTLLPGLIEGHSHFFLHPYNETSWDEQVLAESRAERTARAVNHARLTLEAGFTTVRDLGTEGAFYDDAGLKKAIEKGIVPGPRMIIATRAIVARGVYAPNFGNADVDLHQGAAEAGSTEELEKEVRVQLSKGADVIKIYADYKRNDSLYPSFTIDQLKLAVSIANDAGARVVCHAYGAEGMRRAALAGVSSIEHGDFASREVLQLMKEKKVALCPTLAAPDATLQYKGWKKGLEPEPARLVTKRAVFKMAMEIGVTICMGGDVGVFPHGDNAREMELMVNYGMKPIDVLRSATSVNASVLGISKTLGSIRDGMLADLVAVKGNPAINISDVRQVQLVIKNGKIYRRP